MSAARIQSTFFRGIYEFEDPSGVLLAAKVPSVGTVDLYTGTAVLVKPGQQAVFLYQGQIADVLPAGKHEIKTGNLPLLTRLANWKFGFESPLRCELIFVAGHVMTGRRWGTPNPVMVNMDKFGVIPLRAHGNFNFSVTDPKAFYLKMVGSRTTYNVTELEEFVQGQIVELLPEVFSEIKTLQQLASSYNDLSKILEKKLNAELKDYGITCQKTQLLSALPSKEVIDAIDAKTAIQIIGSQREYLLYKAASTLGESKSGQANDPMHMMMGLMLGKGILGSDEREVKEEKPALEAKVVCACGQRNDSSSNFCPKCGKKVTP